MKKALGMAIIMLFVGSTTAMAQLAGSKTGHDFQYAAWAGSSGTSAGATSGVSGAHSSAEGRVASIVAAFQPRPGVLTSSCRSEGGDA